MNEFVVIKTHYIVSKIFNDLTWKIQTERKELFLTFDDGPIPETTPQVVNILNRYNAKATFFCVGENVSKHITFFDLLKKNGHQVGNHTYNHLLGWKTSFGDYIKNVEKANSLIKSSLFRPPYGKISLKQKTNLLKNYQIIMWDVLSKDYDKNISPHECLRNVIDNARKGSIIVMHDSIKSSKNMLFALPRILEYFSNKGYTFSTIRT